jgi:hypothetical protein
MATIDELLQEARRRGLRREDVVLALHKVIEHNERYRRKPSRQKKKTAYDDLLAETQPALALAWSLLQQEQ